MTGKSCADVTCQNGATCKIVTDGVICSCPAGFHGTYCGLKVTTTTVATTQKPGQTLIYKLPCTSQYSRFYYDYFIQTTRIWEHILKCQAEGFIIFFIITGQRKVIATTEYMQWRTTYFNKRIHGPTMTSTMRYSRTQITSIYGNATVCTSGSHCVYISSCYVNVF